MRRLRMKRAAALSLRSHRSAIVNSADSDFSHFKAALSIGPMKMVRVDLAASGIAFTLDRELVSRDVVIIVHGRADQVRCGCQIPLPRLSIVALVGQKHRQRRAGEHLLGKAAEDELTHAIAAVRPHNQQVRSQRFNMLHQTSGGQ